MLNFFLLFIVAFSLNANDLSEDLTKSLSSSQVKALKERLKLFGLDKTQGELNLSESAEAKVNFSRENVVQNLQNELKTSYLEKAQKLLGDCSKGNCLNTSSSQERIFIDQAGSEHCYPYTNCEYYRCMERQYQCMDVGTEYFQNLAYPTCKAYKKNLSKGKFSAKGREWIYTVMVCLQKGLFEECSLRGNCPISENNQKTCEHITEFTLKFHPGCYINSGVGVCKLPLKDQINIWKTVGPFLTDRERIEAYKVVRYCLFKTPIE